MTAQPDEGSQGVRPLEAKCYAEGFADGKKAALSQSNAEPVTLKTRFEEWAFTRGHRNFTKLGGGYLLLEIQKDWLAFRASLAQSNAEPTQDVRDAAENLLIAIGMGWDLDGCVENLRAALAQSNAEPDPTKVICPNCTHQFTAISVADQERLRVQPNAEPKRAQLHLEDDAQGKRAMLGGYQMPDALVSSLEAQSDTEPVGDESLRDSIIENYRMGVRPIGLIDEFFGFPSMTAPPRPDASEMDQLKADLRNTYQRLETTQVSEEGWKKRCQFIEAELDEARASRPDASAGLIEASEWLEKQTTDTYIGTPDFQKGKIYGISLAIDRLRARAADRSGK